MSCSPKRLDLLARLESLHASVDAAVGPLAARHAARLRCGVGCAQCCIDDLSVFEIEADRIRAHCDEVLHEVAHPPGACAFLDASGACRIYAHRPYVCRTQGLPLRWIEERAGRPIELRDICPLNDDAEPIEELNAAECWTIGPTEERLAELATDRDPREAKRVRLRDLFTNRRERG